MLTRVRDTAGRVGDGFPHWADPESGRWTVTADGDWTGGFWVAMLWLACHGTGEERYRRWARQWVARMRPRIASASVFKAIPVLLRRQCRTPPAERRRRTRSGARGRRQSHAPVQSGARTDPARRRGRRGLAGRPGREQYRQSLRLALPAVGRARDRRRPDARGRAEPRQPGHRIASARGRIVHPVKLARSAKRRGDSPLHPQGIQRHQHLGARAKLGRAAVGDELREGACARRDGCGRPSAAPIGGSPTCRPTASRSGISTTRASRRSSATPRRPPRWLVRCSSSRRLPIRQSVTSYRRHAEATVSALVERYLTPVSPSDRRVPGILTEGCFNKRPDSRSLDAAVQERVDIRQLLPIRGAPHPGGQARS